MFRPRIRLMGHPRPQFRVKADLPVGFPYRFNSSLYLHLLSVVPDEIHHEMDTKTNICSIQMTLLLTFFINLIFKIIFDTIHVMLLVHLVHL